MLHVEIVAAAAAAGKAVFCEKPVGGTPAQTVAAERGRPRRRSPGSGTTTGGRRWSSTPGSSSPTGASADHQLPRPVPVVLRHRPARACCRWRFLVDEAGHGVTTDLLSHSVDLAQYLARSDHRGGRHRRDVHPERPLPGARRDPLRPRRRRRPDRRRHQRGLVRRMRAFASGAHRARSSRRARWSARRARTRSRSTAPTGAMAWNLERMNELRVTSSPTDEPHTGYTTRVRRRAVRRPRDVRARPGQRDRLRGPRHDRGPRTSSPPSPRATRSSPGSTRPRSRTSACRPRSCGRGGRGRGSVVDLREGGAVMTTVRLTTAEAIVRYLIAQRTVDRRRARCRCARACSRSSVTAT